MHTDYSGIFTGTWCFKGIFSLQIKDDTKPYQAPPRCVAYVLQEPFIKELERLKEQQILAPIGIDERVEQFNNFVMVPKPNATVCLCLDSVKLSQSLIRPEHREQKSMIYSLNYQMHAAWPS